MKPKRNLFDAWFKEQKERITSLNELADIIFKNFTNAACTPNYKFHYPRYNVQKPYSNEKCQILTLKVSKIDFKESLCNYWSAPIGKQTNWGAYKKNVPTGYPGFSFHLNISIVGGLDVYMSEILKMFNVHTGTGGSSKKSEYYYDGNIWLEDFPRMSEHYFMSKLTGKDAYTFIPNFILENK